MTPSVEAPALRELVDADEPTVLTLLESPLAGSLRAVAAATSSGGKRVDNPFDRSIGPVAEQAGEVTGARGSCRVDSRLPAIPSPPAARSPLRPSRLTKGAASSGLSPLPRPRSLATTPTSSSTHPNASSHPGYLKMGWHEVGVVATSISPVRPLRLALGARAALRRTDDSRPVVATRDCPLPLIEDVLDTHACDIDGFLTARSGSAGGRLTTRADVAYLRLRYFDVPGLDYRAVSVTRCDRLVGLGIGRMRTRSSPREFTLAEVLTGDGHIHAAATVLRHARRAGADHVATYQPRKSPAAKAPLRGGYLTTTWVGLTLTTLPLHDLPIDPRSPRSWSLALGDLEVF